MPLIQPSISVEKRIAFGKTYDEDGIIRRQLLVKVVRAPHAIADIAAVVTVIGHVMVPMMM